MDQIQIKNKIDEIKNYIISEYCSVNQAKKMYEELKKYEKMLEKR